MKKIVCLIVVFIMLFGLVGCVNTQHVKNTKPTETENSTVSLNQSSDQSTISSQESVNPYAPHEINDDRITVTGKTKTYTDSGITLSVPSNWDCIEVNGEDGGSYYFRHPELGQNCEFSFDITGAEYLTKKRTEAEFLKHLSNITDYNDVQIKTFAEEKLKEFDCIKIVSSFSLNGKQFVRVDYQYLVIGVRWYSFHIIYPEAETESFEAIFETIINSIKFEKGK